MVLLRRNDDGSEAALSFRHWFTTRRSRALKRRLSGSDEVVAVVVVLVEALGVVPVVVEPTVPAPTEVVVP